MIAQRALGAAVRRWKVAAVTSVGGFMVFLDSTIVNIAFPSIERDFPEATRSALSWILSAYSIVFAALLVPAGRSADELGPRRLFLTGVAIFTAASALAGLAPTPETLVLARMVQAAGGALLVPTSLALLLAEFPVEHRSFGVAVWGAVAAIAAAAGPSLGGIIVESGDWRWIFFINIPVGAVAVLYGSTVLDEPPLEVVGLPDILGVALALLGVGALALGIVQGQQWGWASTSILGAFAASAVLLVLMVARSARHHAPVIDLSLFRKRSFAVANAAGFLLSIAFYASLLASSLFLAVVWGYSALEAGLALTPAPLAAALSAGPAGRLADRFGVRPIAFVGCLILAAAGSWYALQLGPQSAFLREWLTGAVLLGLGFGLSYANLTSAAVTDVPSTRYSIGSAVSVMMRQLGAVLGVALTVAVIGSPSRDDLLSAFDGAWILITLMGVGSAAVCVAIPSAQRLPVRRQRAVQR